MNTHSLFFFFHFWDDIDAARENNKTTYNICMNEDYGAFTRIRMKTPLTLELWAFLHPEKIECWNLF